MSNEVWIARDGSGELWQFDSQPLHSDVTGAYDVELGTLAKRLHSTSLPSIKPGECIKFVAAERFVNGEPVQDGETIPVRIAVVANAKREWNAAGWLTDNSPPSDATLFGLAKTLLGCDNLSRTIVVTRVPVPKVTEVQGVVEGTVQ